MFYKSFELICICCSPLLPLCCYSYTGAHAVYSSRARAGSRQAWERPSTDKTKILMRDHSFKTLRIANRLENFFEVVNFEGPSAVCA